MNHVWTPQKVQINMYQLYSVQPLETLANLPQLTSINFSMNLLEEIELYIRQCSNL